MTPTLRLTAATLEPRCGLIRLPLGLRCPVDAWGSSKARSLTPLIARALRGIGVCLSPARPPRWLWLVRAALVPGERITRAALADLPAPAAYSGPSPLRVWRSPWLL